ncbi:MAG: peptide ABC transporter substrate-binding protein [Burkholderiales bacterium]
MKKILTLILAVAMVFTMAACASNQPAPSESPSEAVTSTEPVASEAPSAVQDVAQEATVCVGSEPTTLDPTMNETVDGMIYITHMYEGLYRIKTDGTFELGQAKSVDIVENEDGSATVTAVLRDDIFWSDGKPVTAQDFVFSWRRLVDPAVAASYNYIGGDFFKNGYDVIDGKVTPEELCVEAVDEKTIKFDITANVPYVKDLLAFPNLMPLREDIVSANPEGWATEAEGQVFNGRYTLTEFSHEDQIVMTKNDKYWDKDSTKMGKLTFKLMSDDNAMLAAFKSGELDLIDSMPVDELATLQQTPEYHRYGQIGLYYVQLQQKEGGPDVLKDVRVRQALALAIDRDYINQQVFNGTRVPAYALVPEGILDNGPGTDFRKAAGDVVGGNMTTDYAANVAKAKELLAEAGYPDGKGFPTLEYSLNTNTGHEAVATALKQMWEENLGITVNVSVMEWDVFVTYRKTTDCQITRQGWIGDYTDPATFFDLFKTGAGTNDGGYSNPEYDALIDAARTEKDMAVRAQKYHEAEKILMDDMGMIPIVFYADDVLAQTYFTGYGVTGTANKMFWEAVKTAK